MERKKVMEKGRRGKECIFEQENTFMRLFRRLNKNGTISQKCLTVWEMSFRARSEHFVGSIDAQLVPDEFPYHN
jgi:hypothetical protein